MVSPPRVGLGTPTSSGWRSTVELRRLSGETDQNRTGICDFAGRCLNHSATVSKRIGTRWGKRRGQSKILERTETIVL